MKTMWKRLIAAVCTAVIIAMTITPVMAATAVTGGATRGSAKIVKLGTEYTTNLKSSQDYAIFKFKTNTYKTFYEVMIFNETVTKPFTVYLRGTDKKDALGGGVALKKGGFANFSTWDRTLKTDSWYYIIIRNGNKGAGRIKLLINYTKDLEGNALGDSTVVTVGKNCYGKSDFRLDRDYFKFVPSATGKYRVVVKNVEVGAWLDASLMNSSRTVMGKKSRIYKGDYMSLVKNMEKGKTYYIRVASPCDEYNPRGEKYKVFIQKK